MTSSVRIDIPQPTYQNDFARYADESEYSSYWSTAAWAAGLGPTGSKVHGIMGQKDIGTLTGTTPSIGLDDGRYAFILPGTDEYVSIANEGNYDFEYTDPFTLSCWARRDSAAGFDHVMGKFDETAGRGYRFLLQPAVGYVTNTESVMIDISNDSGSALLIRVATPANSIVINQWHHLMLSYTGSGTAAGVRFYIDGMLQTLAAPANDNLGGNTILNAEPFSIGASSNPTTHPFVGSIDDALIYDGVDLAQHQAEMLWSMKRGGIFRKRRRAIVAAAGAAAGGSNHMLAGRNTSPTLSSPATWLLGPYT